MEFSRSFRGIQQADQMSALVWIFCMRRGHSKMTSPRWLVAQVKEAPDRFDAWRSGCGANAAPRRASNSWPCRAGLEIAPSRGKDDPHAIPLSDMSYPVRESNPGSVPRQW
jgi:hypothetical protein